MAKSTSPSPGATMGASGTAGAPGQQGGAGEGGLKQQASGLADAAQEKVQGQLDQQKHRATDALSGVTDALHKVGDTLRESDHDAFARYASAAAEQLDAFTRSIRNRSVGDLLDEAERFARRDPALFIGGAFLLGVFGARFLKASAPDRFDFGSRYRSGYGPGGQGAYGYTGYTGYGANRFGAERSAERSGTGAYAGSAGSRSYAEPPGRVLHTAGGEMPDPSPSPTPPSTPATPGS